MLNTVADVARAPKCGQRVLCPAGFCIFLLTNPYFLRMIEATLEIVSNWL